jgi:hypothetical protein
MQTVNQDAAAKRAAEIRDALQFFARTLQLASMGYSPDPPAQARTAVRIALAVIKLISDLFPDEPSFPARLIQLRQDPPRFNQAGTCTSSHSVAIRALKCTTRP